MYDKNYLILINNNFHMPRLSIVRFNAWQKWRFIHRGEIAENSLAIFWNIS
jgi:hypothetical protein